MDAPCIFKLNNKCIKYRLYAKLHADKFAMPDIPIFKVSMITLFSLTISHTQKWHDNGEDILHYFYYLTKPNRK